METWTEMAKISIKYDGEVKVKKKKKKSKTSLKLRPDRHKPAEMDDLVTPREFHE